MTLIKAGRPKSQQKRTDILLAATQLFLELGYTRTSMNLVATQANVSKQTVYSHFINKDSLFSAVIEFKCAMYQLDNTHLLDSALSLEDILIKVGAQFCRLMQDQQVIAMYRVLIAEASSAPHVAQLFYDAGPRPAIKMLAHIIQSHTQCTTQDAEYWACTFFNILKGETHMQNLLGMAGTTNSEQQTLEVHRAAQVVVGMLTKP